MLLIDTATAEDQSDASKAEFFPLPERKKPGIPAFSFTAKSLRLWTETIPAAHPEMAAERILGVVREINRLNIDDADRVRFVNTVLQPSLDVLRLLQAKLRNVTTPPGRRELEFAELSILLHQEMALAHRSLLQCQPGRRQLFRRKPQVDQLLHIHLGLYHLCQSMKVHYFINVQPEDSNWDKLYGLYSQLDEQQRQSPLFSAISADGFKNAEDLFKSTLLLHLSDPHSLRGNDLHQLCELLPELAGKASLLPSKQSTQEKHLRAYLVKMKPGAGPPVHYLGSQCSTCLSNSQCFVLDVQAVHTLLRKRMAKLRNEHGGHIAQFVGYELLSHLAKRMGTKYKRGSKRLPGEFDVHVIAGLQQSHRHFSKNNDEPDDKLMTASGKKRSNNHQDFNLLLNLESVTIEAPASFNEIEEQKRPKKDRQLFSQRRTRCQTLNVSQGGYCLRTHHEDGFHLNAGEFVSVRESSCERWLPGTVTWVSTDGSSLHFGVQLLSPHMRTGKAICKREDHIQSAECILLFEDEYDDIPSRILITPGPVTTGDRLLLEYGKHVVDVNLAQELNRTHGFVEFGCEETRVDDLSPETVPAHPNPLDRIADSDLDNSPSRQADEPAETVNHPWKTLDQG